MVLDAESVELLLGWRILTHKNNLTILWNILEVPDEFAIHSIERLKCFLSFIYVLRAQLNNFQHGRHLERVLQFLTIIRATHHWTYLFGDVEIVFCDVLIYVDSQLLLNSIPRLLSFF